MQTTGKGKTIAIWVIKGLLLLLFGFSAMGKLLPLEQATAGMIKFGLGDQILLIGLGELASVLLFVIPRTTAAGVLLLSAYMGGAIATHMQHGEAYVMPALVLVLVWLVGWLSNRAMLGGLIESRSVAARAASRST
ncbi:MAG: DoxX family protein [Myxococcota bacterium]